MKKYKTYIIVALSFFYSCSKDKNDEGGGSGSNSVWAIPQAVKDYTLFKPGTYWVYQDSATAILDSVYVYDYHTGIDTNYYSQNNLNGYFEYFFVYSRSALDGYDLTYWVDMSWTKAYGITPLWFSRDKAGDFVGQTFLMIYPFLIGKKNYPYTDVGIVTPTWYFDSIKMDNIFFKKVAVFNNTKNIAYHKAQTNFYFAKNIGIVRKEIIDSSQVWNLVRYNIIQ